MPAKFTARIPSHVQYGYYEVEADTFAELVEGVADVDDYMASTAPASSGAVDQAVQNLTNAGLRTSLPGLNTAKPAASLGGGARSQQQGGRDEIELGKLDDGTIITVHPTGKYGPYVKAYVPSTKDKHFANLPKGAAPEQIDLATAVGLIEQKLAA